METKIEKEVRLLKAYAIIATLVCGVLILTAFTAQNQKQKFDEIDVGRINIVEKDGQVKMVIANKEKLPGPGNIMTGEFSPRQGIKAPGILFYNEKGDESGGLGYASMEKNGKYGAGTLLAFDKYNGDQIIGMSYNDDTGKRTVGFNIWDQPDVPPAEQDKNFEAAKKLPKGAERDTLMQQAVGQQRVFIGRGDDKSAKVILYDLNSRPRIRMSVGADGEPKLEFLDVSGKIIQTLPITSNAPKQ